MSGGHSSSVTCIAGSEDGDLLVTGGFDGEVHLFHVSGKRLVKKFVHSQPVKIETPVGTDGTALPTPPPSSGDMDEDDWGDDDEEDEEKEMVQSVECVGISRTELKYEVFHSAPLISCHVSDGWLLVERIRT
jgi:WD40 repeat protein